MAKKMNKQNPLTLPKIRQSILAYYTGFFAHTSQKGAPPPPPIVFRAKLKVAKAKEKGENTASKTPTSGSFTPAYATYMRQPSVFLA